MRRTEVGKSIIAVLAIGLMVAPYAKPFTCGATDQDVMQIDHSVGLHTSTSHGDGGSAMCHDVMGCSVATTGIATVASDKVPWLPTHGALQRPVPDQTSGNLRVPLTPPPRV